MPTTLDGPTISRRALLAALKERRDNDVYVCVRLESGGTVHLAIESVRYDPLTDTIIIVTEQHIDGPAEPDTP